MSRIVLVRASETRWSLRLTPADLPDFASLIVLLVLGVIACLNSQND